MFQDTTPRFWYLLNFGTGYVVSFFAFCFYMATRMTIHFSKIVHFIWNWQTLIAGLIALLGAWLTVKAVKKQILENRNAIDIQILETRNLDEDMRERKEYADRAAMPSALVDILEYLRKNLLGHKMIHIGTAPPMPAYPSAAVETIRTCLETTPRNRREPLRHLIVKLQVIHSRLESSIAGMAPGATTPNTE